MLLVTGRIVLRAKGSTMTKWARKMNTRELIIPLKGSFALRKEKPRASVTDEIIMGEMNATMTLSEGRITTLPLLLYRLINSYNYQGACAVGTVLIVTTLLIFLFAELLGGRRWKN